MRFTRKSVKFAAALLAIMFSTAPGLADTDPDAVMGAWVTEDGRGVVFVHRCSEMTGAVYCGTLAPIQTGDERPLYCGYPLMRNFIPDGRGEWADGIIVDPRDGSEWDAVAWIEDGILHVRGFLGITLFGQTQEWPPWDGNGRICRE